MIEKIQEDKLGETCREAQRIIRDQYKRLSKELDWREMMFNYEMEMFIKHG